MLVSAGGSPLLARLYGPAYLAGSEVLIWLALGMLAVAIAAPLQLALLAIGAPITNVYHHGTGLILLASCGWLWFDSLTLAHLGYIFALANLASASVLAGHLALRLSQPER